jgi:prostaglandin-H2 D-isomerase / glutathione transferase
MSTPLQIYYFDFPFWRAEISRIALHASGQPFEDVRLQRDEFRALKASGELPFGQVPALKVGDTFIAQTGAIARYCGRLAGLYPQDALMQAQVDQVIDTLSDITMHLGRSMRITDPEEKSQARAVLAEETLPLWLGFLERLLNKSDSHFFVGSALTMADLAVWRGMGWLTGGIIDGIPSTLLNDFPQLQTHFDTVESHAVVTNWKNR